MNNFLHDMATGTWAACVLVIAVLDPRAAVASPGVAAALGDAMRAVFWLLAGSLVVIAATGGIRLAYWRQQAAPEHVEAKRTALIVKHVAFLLVYGAGTTWAWLAVRG